MNKLEEIYGNKFFRKRDSLEWRTPLVCSAIKTAYPNIKSICDVGCATGSFLKGFLGMGLEADGIEGSIAAKPYSVCPDGIIKYLDFRLPVDVGKRDLVISLEMAEHVEPEFAEIYTKNLCNISDNVLISAAPPGQGGHYHVNCQPKEYWIKLFDQVDFSVDYHIMKVIHREWEPVKTKKAMSAYYSNLIVFRRN